MSDDQPTRDETAVSFSERVTIDTLADRPSIPSFDTHPEEWQPETALRLEGIVEERVYDRDHGRFTDKVREVPTIVIFGPGDGREGRPIAVFEKATGTTYHPSTQAQEDRGLMDNFKGSAVGVLHEGDTINVIRNETGSMEEGNFGHPDFLKFQVKSIKSGPLT